LGAIPDRRASVKRLAANKSFLTRFKRFNANFGTIPAPPIPATDRSGLIFVEIQDPPTGRGGGDGKSPGGFGKSISKQA
jgi:hypothetical protein